MPDVASHRRTRIRTAALSCVAGLGCDAAQGYWFAVPMPYDALEAMVRVPSVRPLEPRAIRSA